MPKSQRLLELMMAVNQKKRFTVKELAGEFGVSSRTILRDLQELSGLGVPLYSEVGPHGGYRILRERMLPPIAFTEEEAAAVFFAVDALRHYASLPFETEAGSVLRKLTHYLPPDTRERIAQMRNRVDFAAPARQADSPYLALLLDAAVRQQPVLVDYASREERSERSIQPVGIYTRNGLWYCCAYCFRSGEIRVFRCDRMHAAALSAKTPVDLQGLDLRGREPDNMLDVPGTGPQAEAAATAGAGPQTEAADMPGAGLQAEPAAALFVTVRAELTRAGAEVCGEQPWTVPRLHLREDGTGWLEGPIAVRDMNYFAKFFIGLGKDSDVLEPPALLARIREQLTELTARYHKA